MKMIELIKEIPGMKCIKCDIRKTHKGCNGLCIECFHGQDGRFCKECNRLIYSVKYMLCSTCYNRYILLSPLKIKCHNILGWECVCCKRNDISHLEIEHIKRVEGKRMSLGQTYREIVSMGQQAHEIYQIMCHICNTSKNKYDKCNLNHKYDLNNLREAISHLKELGVKDLDNIKIPSTI